MRRVVDRFFRVLEIILVLLLAGMVIMVFGNVVLRYLFDSGIDISEELSRYFFVWLTFIGAVVVAREHSHLGVDTLVRLFGRAGRRICVALSDVFVLVCCLVFFWGTWKQEGINASAVAPITGLPMSAVFDVGYFTSIGIGLMTAVRLYRTLFNRITDNELAIFAGEYDQEEAENLKGRLE
jgi:TRAP-type C4-dicarboxylate transport system permease small subunit